MSVKCPTCNHPLYLEISVSQTFSIEKITTNDVHAGELLEEERLLHLMCMNCDFNGWIDKYHIEASGITHMFNKEKKLKCTCFSK